VHLYFITAFVNVQKEESKPCPKLEEKNKETEQNFESL